MKNPRGKNSNIVVDVDQDLVKRCQKGDQQAKEQIISKYKKSVYNVAYDMLRNKEDAEDITQKVFEIVLKKISKFKFESKFSTWLYPIVRNVCIIDLNSRKRQVLYEVNSNPPEPTPVETPEDNILRKERDEILLSAIARLKPKHREVLIYREFRDRSYKEIAKLMDISSEGRVKSLLHEARLKLRKSLKDYEMEALK